MDDLLQQGITAYRAGKRDEARRIFIVVIKQNQNSERAWGWMYNVCNNDQERIQCLQQILRINPENEKANQLFNKLTSDLFPLEQQLSSVTTKAQSPISSESVLQRLPTIPTKNVGEYVKSIILPNERVLAVAKIHWVVYLSSLILFAFAFLASLDTNNFFICGFLLWVIAGIGLLRAFLIKAFTEFALTDKRVIAKVGIIRRSSLELVLGKVESIQINQSLLGRLLNYGTLVISGSGGTHQVIPCIAEPMKMKQTINSVLAE
ncbi:MAG: hypothetical protein B6D39_13225 [Anaerolineae bacterium UTCFX2]|nr:PH domain-containing protein [Anaerolineales bacterium]OQY87218.1 MAG: hypothetical protein B6D39_13225 [Anaerolineae bacterium UTCFX2]